MQTPGNSGYAYALEPGQARRSFHETLQDSDFGAEGAAGRWRVGEGKELLNLPSQHHYRNRWRRNKAR